MLRRLLPVDRYIFQKINRQLNLGLDYTLNRDAVSLLHSIFVEREYAPFFPFYREATIVDIGAHYGYFTLFALKNTQPSSRFFCIEPSPDNFEVLEKNLAAQQSTAIQCLNLAIARTSGPQQLYTGPSYNHSLFSDTKEGKTIPVKGLSVDDLLEELAVEKVDFLKMDCEGAEYPALLHCSSEALDKIQTIALEFHDLRSTGFTPNDLIQRLRQQGFEIVQYTFDTDYSYSNLNFGKIIATKNPS
ncbi:MAG: FkbM family methyltransferase [Bacteroidota bacterium]